MTAPNQSFAVRFRSYVGWGLVACVFLVVPLIALDWLVKNLPFLDDFLAWLKRIDTPIIAIGLGLVVAVAALATLGWLLRRVFWDRLSGVPVLGTLLTSGQQLAKALERVDRERQDLVVWMPALRYRSLGVIMSYSEDADGTEYANVYVFYGAGQFQGNQIANVELSSLTFPGWTVDEAIVFSSSGGAVVPSVSPAPSARAD